MATSNIKLAFKQDTRGLKATEAATKRTATAVRGLSSAAASLGLAFGAAGLLQVFRKSSEAYIKQEQAIAQLEAGLRSTNGAIGMSSQAIQQMAADLQKLTLFGDESTIEMVSLLTTFKKIGAETAPRASKAILDVATRMGMDLKSAAVQVGKALHDPATGLSMLTRVGITFSEAQKVAIKSLMDMGDVAGAQALILDELETQFGGSAEAAAQAAGGGFRQFKNMMGDISEDIGSLLVPSLDELARRLAEGDTAAVGFADALKIIAPPLAGFIHNIKKANKELERQRDQKLIASFFEDIEEGAEAVKKANPTLKDLIAFLQEAKVGLKGIDFKLPELGESITVLAMTEEEAAKAAAELANQAAKVAARAEGLRDRIADLNDQITLLVNNEKLAESQAKSSAEWNREFAASIDDIASAAANVDLDAWMSGIGEGRGGLDGLTEGALEALDEAARQFELDEQNSRAFRTSLSWIVSDAITSGINNGFNSDTARNAVTSFFSMFGPGGQVVGAMMNFAFLRDEFEPVFTGLISGLDRVAGALKSAADAFQSGIISILQLTGGLLNFSNIGVVQRGEGAYEATASRSGGLTAPGGPLGMLFDPDAIDELIGRGATAAEAVDDLIRQLVERIEEGTNEGLLDLIGFSEFFVTAIKNSGAESMADLQRALQVATDIFKAGLGPVHASIFEAFNNMGAMAAEAARLGLSETSEFAAALRNGIQDAISGIIGGDLYPAFADVGAALDSVAAGLERLGIVGKAARQYLSDAATALEVYNSRLKSDVLQQIVGVFSNIPKMAEKAAAIQAQVDQARMIIEVAISKIRLRELFESGLIQKSLYQELRKGLRQAGRWAKDLDHFIQKVPAAIANPNVTVVVPDGGGGGGGGGGTGGGGDPESRKTRNWQAFKAWLAARGLDWREIPAADLAAFKAEWRRDPSGGFERAPAGGGVGGGGGIVQTFRDIWTSLIDGLREFQKSLNLSSFAPGTPRELANKALSNVQDLFNKAMGGDTDALKAFQAAAQQALTLGSAAFGNATGHFQQIFFDAIQNMIDQLKAVDPNTVDPANNPTVQAVNNQTSAVVGGLDTVGARVFALQRATEAKLDRVIEVLGQRSGAPVPAV